jgi:predicted aspartyl protease
MPQRERVKFRLAGRAQPLALVPVQINGTGPFEFILDTGAGTTLVAPHAARGLSLQQTGTREGQTAGGRVTVALSNVDTLQVGRGRANNLQVAITDLSHLGRVIGAQPDGDLGYNF